MKKNLKESSSLNLPVYSLQHAINTLKAEMPSLETDRNRDRQLTKFLSYDN